MLNKIKLKNTKISLNKNKSRLFSISPPIYDNNKICINMPINTIDKINKLYNSKVKENEINNVNRKDYIKNIDVSFDAKNAQKYKSNIYKSSLLKISQKRKIDKNKILLKSYQYSIEKEKENNIIIDEANSKKWIPSFIVFFFIIIIFLFNNSKKAQYDSNI